MQSLPLSPPTFPLLAVLLLMLASCAGVRKVPFVDHNLPGALQARETSPGAFDLTYTVADATTVHEFRRYAAHHVADLCLDQGYSYFTVLKASPPLRQSQDTTGGERRKNREATGRVLFMKNLPADKSKAVFNAQDMHDNMTVFDSAGDA